MASPRANGVPGPGPGHGLRRPAAVVVAVARHPIPEPPERLRRGPFRGAAARQVRADPRTTAVLGAVTGLVLLVCFVTGVISHLHQHPPAWLDVPSRPVWGYQLTQGVHVAAGIALIPLVLAKLWLVYPRLFSWPPVRSIGHALERLLVVPLVAGTLFQLVTGLADIVQWYPWGFYFPATHRAVAWLVVGALLVHVAVKLPLSASARRTGPEIGPGPQGEERPGPTPDHDRPGLPGTVASPDRRALLLGVAAAAGAVTVATVGQTVTPLSGVSLLAPRRAGSGPQGVPINRTAGAAGVTRTATDPAWRLHLRGGTDPGRPSLRVFSLADLAELPQHTVRLPIACVEGWSSSADWTGPRLRDLLELAGIRADARLRAVSLETGGLYGSSPIGPAAARDPFTLLALRLNGDTLSLDHGFPVRLIAPNRPGVQQTKWLSAIEVAS